MDELYLIAHVVSGAIAYDVAQRWLLSNGRPLWLIPTSGHQAYPLRWIRLDESLAVECSAEELASVPDHYSPKATCKGGRKAAKAEDVSSGCAGATLRA